jgi:hypothetical protein
VSLSCSDATLALGGYVVGALDPRVRADVEAHLGRCPACRDELASLAPLPGLMSRLSLDDVLADPPPTDDAMLERLLRAAAREREVARRRRWLTAAAAVVVIGGAAGGAVASYDAVSRPAVHAVSAASGPVHMRVQLASAPGGTQLTLWLSGVPHEQRCRLVAVSDSGAREVAGSWEATYSGAATITGVTSIPYAHLSQLVVETLDGRQLVTAPV